MKKRILVLLITLLITTILPFSPTGAGPDPEFTPFTGFQVHFLDVGQGDCAVVLCDGEAMVIDGGPAGSARYVYSYLRDTLRLSHLDYVVSTHPHIDHVGGLAAVLNAVPADLLLTPVKEWDSKAFRAMMDYADRQGTAVAVPQAGDTLRLGRAAVTILHCWPEAIGLGRTNDASIVLRVDYGKTSFLFTGDAEDWAEYMMIDAGASLKANVLKVSHHGSYTATTEEFLRAVQPEIAVISVGAGNEYGHPHGSVISRLQARHCAILRTDEEKTIVLTSDAESVRRVR